MQRDKMLQNLISHKNDWDILIIGGGATGVGAAIDAASRGYQVLLVEQADFGKGTSSRSTKLAHGGVRYLQQGNISLVLEALKERGVMRRNAPHLVHDLPFVVPVYDWWQGPFYGIGLKLYDLLAGKEGFGKSLLLSKEETLEHLPTIETEGLKGGVIYHDGQFDDARLLINMVQTAVDQGATMLNYAKVESLIKEKDELVGANIIDVEAGYEFEVRAKVIINATGVFTDSIRKMDEASVRDIMTSSQGVHLVLNKSFLPGKSAIMVPHTDDGRVLFAVPWLNKTLIGTTDTPVQDYSLEPKALESEIQFLLTHAARYLTKDPKREDVNSVFTGLRPLVKNGNNDDDTASISRDHTITISRGGLISIAGGKWTTYRKMAEDVIDQARDLGDLPPRNAVTQTLQIHAYHNNSTQFGYLSSYGADALRIEELMNEDKQYSELLHPNYEIRKGEVVWAVREEMARTVEDFLARRTRLLLFDAKASVVTAVEVARLMSRELGRDKAWEEQQILDYTSLAKNYILLPL